MKNKSQHHERRELGVTGVRRQQRRMNGKNIFHVSTFDAPPSKRCKFYGAALSLLIFGEVILLLLNPSAHAGQTCKNNIHASNQNSKYTILSNGTAIHNTTGLMWMRCSLGQTWNGKTCTGEPANYTWQEGLQAADRHEFAGYDDWRLPNKNELESIVEERCNLPSINNKVFPRTPLGYSWSSSPYAGFSYGAWSVDFGYGAVNASDKDGGIFVRLVRDEQR